MKKPGRATVYLVAICVFLFAVIDLNGLKETNDQYGHEQGDRAIVKLASALKQSFDGECVYRIGGDEFIAIVEGDYSDIEDRLLNVVRLLGEDDTVSVSKGHASFDRDVDIGFREVFNRADKVMYDDKRKYYMTHADRRRH